MVGRLARPAAAPGDPGRCPAGEGVGRDGLRPLAGGVHVRRHRGRGGPGVAQGAGGRCRWGSAGWSPATRPTTSCRCGSTGSPTGSSAATPTCRSSVTRRSWAGRSSGRPRPRRPSMTLLELQAVFNFGADVVPALAAGEPRAGPGDEGSGRADAEEAGRVPGRTGSAAGDRGGGTGSRSRTARRNFTGSPGGCSIGGARRGRSSSVSPDGRKSDWKLPMPRQNRVTPFGEIVAVPERGTIFGNRGVLHDAGGRIRRPWQVQAVADLPAGVPGAAPGGHGPGPLHRALLPRRGDRPGRRASPVLRVPPCPVPAPSGTPGRRGMADRFAGETSGRRRSTTGCTPSGSARIAPSGPSGEPRRVAGRCVRHAG